MKGLAYLPIGKQIIQKFANFIRWFDVIFQKHTFHLFYHSYYRPEKSVHTDLDMKCVSKKRIFRKSAAYRIVVELEILASQFLIFCKILV